MPMFSAARRSVRHSLSPVSKRNISLASPLVKDLIDTVSVKNLAFKSKIDNKVRDIKATIDLKTSFYEASITDDLKYSINYAVLSRDVKNFTTQHLNDNHNFKDLAALSRDLFSQVLFKQNCALGSLKLSEVTDKCEVVVHLNRFNDLENAQLDTVVEQPDKVFINNLELMTIIGVFKEERLAKQPVILNIELDVDDLKADQVDYYKISTQIAEYIENSEFKTVEALVLNVSKLVLSETNSIKDCKVQVWKPTAIDYTEGVGVSIIRDLKDSNKEFVTFDQKGYIPNLNTETSIIDENKEHVVYIAFGSNVGDQLQNIRDCMSFLKDLDIEIMRTSSLYQSKPMYFLDQPSFINGVFKCTTKDKPQELLSKLKKIEYDLLNRVKEFNNGPRSIDLDIILYDNVIINDENLNIPHISMLERSFVLAPLCELISPDFIHPVTAEPIHNHLKQLFSNTNGLDKAIQESIDLINVVPLPGNNVIESDKFLQFDLINNKAINTKLMGVLNITLDSFSDGGMYMDESAIMDRVQEMVDRGVDIIDIGGCSTRPNSVQVSEEEELNRVIPAVKLIKEKYPHVVISIDTYRAKVAEESIKNGADIINDISGGQFDSKMFDVVAKYQVPYILSHTRGNIDTMNDLTDYSQKCPEGLQEFYPYTPNLPEESSNTILNVSRELTKVLNEAYSKGINKWQIILDPGLGFAKTTRQNMEIIKHLPIIKRYSNEDSQTGELTTFKGLPMLLGPSRKRFVGEISNESDPKQRVFGTMGITMSLIQYESDIIRLHDFKQGKDVIKLGDYLYKQDI